LKQKRLEQASLTELSDWEKRQAVNAHHRALILQILNRNPGGLTTQAIVQKERDYYGYTFLTDNRLRELRAKGLIESYGDAPIHWRVKT
jgi:hypothetical protein